MKIVACRHHLWGISGMPADARTQDTCDIRIGVRSANGRRLCSNHFASEVLVANSESSQHWSVRWGHCFSGGGNSTRRIEVPEACRRKSHSTKLAHMRGNCTLNEYAFCPHVLNSAQSLASLGCRPLMRQQHRLIPAPKKTRCFGIQPLSSPAALQHTDRFSPQAARSIRMALFGSFVPSASCNSARMHQ